MTLFEINDLSMSKIKQAATLITFVVSGYTLEILLLALIGHEPIKIVVLL